MGFIQKIRASRTFQRLMRVLQFLSAIISLGLFTARLVKILRLTQLASHSNGAVEGILAAAVLYSLMTMLMTFLLKHGAGKMLRWAMILLDLLFMAAFIIVSVLTRPNGGSSGPCKNNTGNAIYGHNVTPTGGNCNLPWGTFFLAILSTLLHFLTAIFYEVRDHLHGGSGKGDNDYMNSNPSSMPPSMAHSGSSGYN